MGSKPHPLDVFRSTPKGFDSATTDPKVRRKVQGKVLATTRREEGEDDAPRRRTGTGGGTRASGGRSAPNRASGGRTAAKAPRRVQAERPATTASVLPPRRPTKSRIGHGAKLLYAALGIVLVVSGYIWLLGPDDDGTVPLKTPASSSASHAPLRPAGGDGPSEYTIQLSSYKGSDKSVEIAQAAQQEMFARGFDSTRVLGFQDEAGGFSHVALTVGKASSPEDLQELLASVRGIDDWQSGNDPRPFRDAHIIASGP